MSYVTTYVQGTIVKVTAKVNDPETNQPVDPPDLVAKIEPPGATTYTLTFSLGEMTRVAQGVYLFRVDTSPVHGFYEYQVTATGSDRVVERGNIQVVPAL